MEMVKEKRRNLCVSRKQESNNKTFLLAVYEHTIAINVSKKRVESIF